MKYRNKIIFHCILLCLCLNQFAWATDYKVAVRAHRGIENAIKQWQPTLNLLNTKFPGDNFNLVPIIKLTEISERTGKNEFNFVITNPSSYVEIHHLYGANALATLNNKRANTAQEKFGSVIFTHAHHTDIVTLHDLKNKTLMAVSKPAFGGWRVAWQEMLTNGFDPHRELKELLFTKTGTQSEVVYSILNGKADAGVVRTDLLERLEAKGKIDMRYLRILNNKDIKDFPFFLSTRLYPEWAFAATKQTTPDIAQQVASALFNISKNNRAAIKGKYIGWNTPDSYQSVQSLMKKLEVGPYAH